MYVNTFPKILSYFTYKFPALWGINRHCWCFKYHPSIETNLSVNAIINVTDIHPRMGIKRFNRSLTSRCIYSAAFRTVFIFPTSLKGDPVCIGTIITE